MTPLLLALVISQSSPQAPTEAPAVEPTAESAPAAPVAAPAPQPPVDAPPAEAPQSWADRLLSNTAPIGLGLHAEVGFVGVLSHHIQLSRGGSDIDYLKDGGQNTLFPFLRFSADVKFLKRHAVVLLYQPLELSTPQLARRDLVVDGETFKAGTPMDFGYGFSFWRLSYLYNFLWAHPGEEFALGASLQIRNARITFSSRDGTQFRSNEDIGPVPIVKLRARHTFPSKFWLGAEVDGFFAGTPGFNGSDSQFIGAILDASLRMGVELTPSIDGFLNVRTILGGAVGTEKRPTPPSDGYVNNWLYTMSLSVGFSLKSPGR
ncbi:MAG: hypothetical protein K1X89_18340 [Myxococcaceae bacterium]|nr:hypothetical protein [Myxococcaceae bacterium]